MPALRWPRLGQVAGQEPVARDNRGSCSSLTDSEQPLSSSAGRLGEGLDPTDVSPAAISDHAILSAEHVGPRLDGLLDHISSITGGQAFASRSQKNRPRRSSFQTGPGGYLTVTNVRCATSCQSRCP
jgi:hypothetical protein